MRCSRPRSVCPGRPCRTAQKATLAQAFTRYTVSSYLANFNSYNGESFQVLPAVRTVGNGDVIVQSRLLPANGSPIELDYVMRRFPAGWQAVDVLMNGSISRVAVQRSDFTHLMGRGGAPALVLALNNKVSNLSGGGWDNADRRKHRRTGHDRLADLSRPSRGMA